MGYDLSIPFSNKEETTKVLIFLNQILVYLNAIDDLYKDLFRFDFATGNEIGVYAPKHINKDHLISMSGTIIPQRAFDVACWIASMSSIRKNEQPIYFYDDDVKKVIN